MLEPRYIVKFGERVPEEALSHHGEITLNVSEFFFDTIQGEGLSLGKPAAFLRLAGCPVDCRFCDTAAVWKTSQRVRVSWLVDRIIGSGLGRQLANGREILVVTGGSPLLQQDHLLTFFEELDKRLPAYPYVEVENECSIVPREELGNYVHWWNNSPKLANSLVDPAKRYKPEALKAFHDRDWPCTFKFVVRNEEDWIQIVDDYIKPGYVDKSEICLMPMGADQEEYFKNREQVIGLAIEHGVRYSPREHIAVWNKKTGI